MRSSSENLSSGIGVFAAVVDAGTFAAAADMMSMSPPGVSRAIARLEKRLNIRLFNRTTRAVSLTEEGRRFYEQVMPHLRGMEEAATAAAGGGATVRGKLRINLDPAFLRIALSPKLDEFMDAHPELEIEFIARDQLGDLIVDGFDLALRFGEPRSSSLIARKLLDTPVVTVAAPSYLARRGRPTEPQDLGRGQHRCLEFRNPETGKPFPWEFHRKRKKLVVETNGRLTVNDPSALLNACLAGSGIAQMLLLGAEPLIREGRLVNLFPDWPDERFPFYAYHPSRHHTPAKTRVFLDFIVALTRTS
ncbi:MULTISPECIES: LysR family transcriptional regulator [Paraburkholderia]|uniref:LysR family transcriptional regulator n=1 Tax=Paraburkholderia TaxID=1822464 RepID=UPI00225B8E39|nr:MULTISPECIES: LysR family transcriptional regulator [Paraburkholderia]MCX4163832.1 LysR substrate-binding domain-containing protein [Paraburkholderia megapolitana]MDN7159327.1 LysR substrate-binding domain-containing protein [Paraburkholderia sp. CHISQ3]MDQ6496374.1 LysR substrate-binding domain-containing protein [Paraburkholderia megapolitana]